MFSFRQAIIFGMVFASATLIGYDSGYLNGVLGSKDFQRRYGVSDDGGQTWYLTPRTRSLFSSLLVAGIVLGCCIPSILPDKVGRKGSFLLAALTYTAGVSMQAAGPPYAVFILGRILLGAGLGLISVVSPGYLVDASTGTTRGRMTALYQQLLTCGNVLACSISLGTSKLPRTNSWRITIVFQLVLALFVLIGAAIAPESPVILMRRNKPLEASKSLAQLRNLDPESEEITNALQEIQDWLTEQSSFGSIMGFMTIATGVTFWFGYGTTFFMAAGVKNAYLVSLIIALVNAIFTAPSVYLIEKIGRRASMIWGGAITRLAQLLTAIIHTISPHSTASNNMLIAGAVLFIASYAATWDPVGWVTMTEPFSARLRTLSTSVTMVVYWISTWAVGFVMPYIVDATAADLGVNITYIWVGMVILSMVDMLFGQKVTAWRSVSWAKQLRLINGVNAVDDCNSGVEHTVLEIPVKV